MSKASLHWKLFLLGAAAAGCLVMSSCGYDFSPGAVPDGPTVGAETPGAEAASDGGMSGADNGDGNAPGTDPGMCEPPVPPCDDQDPCTTDTYSNGVCNHQPATGGTCKAGGETGCCRTGYCCTHPSCHCRRAALIPTQRHPEGGTDGCSVPRSPAAPNLCWT